MKREVHEITVIIWPTIFCYCGWECRLPRADDWGRKAGTDRLLDEYNFHKKKKADPGAA